MKEAITSKLTVFRAISSLFALRMIKLFTIIALAIFGILFVITWLLATLWSAWWWLLLIPIFIGLLVFFIIRTVAWLIAKGLYRRPLARETKTQLDAFIDKLQRLIELRGMSLKFFAIIMVKDLLVHQELRTLKQILEDSKTLRKDFQELEKNLKLTTE